MFKVSMLLMVMLTALVGASAVSASKIDPKQRQMALDFYKANSQVLVDMAGAKIPENKLVGAARKTFSKLKKQEICQTEQQCPMTMNDGSFIRVLHKTNANTKVFVFSKNGRSLLASCESAVNSDCALK